MDKITIGDGSQIRRGEVILLNDQLCRVVSIEETCITLKSDWVCALLYAWIRIRSRAQRAFQAIAGRLPKRS